jgi:hypothetical protein
VCVYMRAWMCVRSVDERTDPMLLAFVLLEAYDENFIAFQELDAS